MEKFENLKGRKQILLKENNALETKSQELKDNFEDNRNKKETVIQSFERADSVERKIMQEFDNLKSKKKYIEDNIAMSMYTQESAEEKLEQEDKQNEFEDVMISGNC